MAKEPRAIIKTGPHFKRYNDGTIYVMDVRFSYPNLARPYEGTNDDGQKTAKYGVRGLAPKKTHKAVKDELVLMKNEFLKANKIEKIKPDSFFVKDGDLDDKPEYEGHWVIGASENVMPRMRDRKGNVINPDWFGTPKYPFFPGCLGNMLIRPWWMNNKYGKKVNANLVAVQFVMDDGVVFGEGRISDDEIDETITSLDDGDTDGGYDDDGTEGL